jgi:hypothetical protein
MTTTRAAIQAMLDEQPLPLRGQCHGASTSSTGPSSPTPLAPPR